MRRAFKYLRLPLGAYQRVEMTAVGVEDDRDQHMLSATFVGTDGFKEWPVRLLLGEQAQRDLIRALAANLLAEDGKIEIDSATIDFVEHVAEIPYALIQP